jgi:hypothetical protein
VLELSLAQQLVEGSLDDPELAAELEGLRVGVLPMAVLMRLA